MEKFILKADTYKSLLTIRRKYKDLSKESFPCDGSGQLWELLLNIIDIITERLNGYSSRQIQLLNTILPAFDEFCKLLDGSVVSKVPWSVLPSLEHLFSIIRRDALFTIVPQWEFNYGIICKNIIELIADKIVSVPGFIFDNDSDFDNNKEKLLSKYTKENYLLLYPIGERLHPLHFPLLGHEIGHIFADEWLVKSYDDKIDKLGLPGQVDSYLKKHIPPHIQSHTILENIFLNTENAKILKSFRRIVVEIIADCVGVIIFGPSALLSSFVLSVKFGYSNFNAIDKGYLPWRYRLYFISKIIEHLGTGVYFSEAAGVHKWIAEIEKIIVNYDYVGEIEKQPTIAYYSLIYKMLEQEICTISDEICLNIPAPHYSDIMNVDLQKEVFDRLDNGIIPNCKIYSDLKEDPIDFRNIIIGTWLFICEQPIDKLKEFIEVSRNANLLSLKAIELSHLQAIVGT